MDDSFGNWLAGFVDGEGCFSIARVTSRKRNPNNRTWPNCVFAISLRADDAPLLATIRDTLEMGHIRRNERGGERPNQNPVAVLTISRIGDCLRLVEFFQTYPLRGKKAAQFLVWADAVHEMLKGTDRSDDQMEVYRAQLAELRHYTEPERIAEIVAENPPALRHRRDYGIAPHCLCGCGAITKIVSTAKSLAHPDNPNYCAFQRGHNLRHSLIRPPIPIAVY